MQKIWIALVAVVAALTAGAILISIGVPGSVLEDEPEVETVVPNTGRGTLVVEIAEGDSAGAIAEVLVSNGVIASARRFETLVSLLGYGNALAAGRYDFEPGLTTTEVIERIRAGLTTLRPPLIIREGLRLEEIADAVAAAGVVARADFLVAVRNPANWRGTPALERPQGASLEGYPFPGSYTFSELVTADEVVQAMLERLNDQFSTERLLAIRGSGRSVHEVLTLASIIEREAVLPEEQALIASVFWNRLRAGMPLEADATVQYALSQEAENVAAFGYWKTGLREEDLAVASPYNTYVSAGLPPTPIAAPGVGAIDAAIRPANTNFLFFVARGDGSHAFAETFEEHLQNVEVFQGGADEAGR